MRSPVAARLALCLLLPSFAWAPWSAAANRPPPGAVPAAATPAELCRSAVAQAEREAGLPPRLLAAIARVESGRRDPEGGGFGPWPWTINAEGRGSIFPDRAAALAAVRAQQGAGARSIDVGCMQINLRHYHDAFASLEEAFGPLANARYAARFLTTLQVTRNDWMRSAGHYHSQTPDLAEAYRARVAAAWEAERGAPDPRPLPAGAPPSIAPVAMAASTGPWLLNRPERVAAMLPAAGASLGVAGRGLDAYRALPIPVAGRAMPPPPAAAAPAPVARVASPSLARQPTPGAAPPLFGRAGFLPPAVPSVTTRPVGIHFLAAGGRP